MSARRLTIDGVEIEEGGACYVIAEIGHNHQGDLQQAKDLIAAAKECGADAVKLQKRSNRSLYTREFFDQPYDNEFSFGRTYGEHREALELSADEYAELHRLVGDASKAREQLGWRQEIGFEQLTHLLVDADVNRLRAPATSMERQ